MPQNISSKSLEKMFSDSLIEKEFCKLLSNPTIKVVSFDIFDTLFFRKCGSPINIFEKMCKHKEIAAKFDIYSSFTQYRQHAEKNARRLHPHKEDITLEEIYEQLPLAQQERKRFQQIEILIEKEMLVVNPQLERWIKFAFNAGKKVILISDMYLSTTQIKEVALNKLKCTKEIHKIYISNEYQKTKATGTLFDVVLQEYKLIPNQLLHIGDNERSDIAIAKEFGIHTLYYGQNKQQKEKMNYETYYMKKNFEDGNHVRYLSSLLNPYTDTIQEFYFTIGSTIFAPLLWEFSHWLKSISQKFNIEQYNFIMREGAIFQKFFTHLYPDIQTNLIYASRKSTNFLTLQANDIGSVNFSTYKTFSIENLYESFFLKIIDTTIQPYADTLCEEAHSIAIKGETLLSLIISDIQDKTHQIEKSMDDQKKYLLNYLTNLRITADTSFIDFGGGGTIIKRITEFLPKPLRPNLSILFYQHAQGYKNLSSLHLLSFLPYTKNTAKSIQSIQRTPEFIEILLNGTHATTLNYKKKWFSNYCKYMHSKIKSKTLTNNH